MTRWLTLVWLLGILTSPAFGQAPRTPFDHIVYATANINHLDAAKSQLWPTIITELTELVRRGG